MSSEIQTEQPPKPAGRPSGKKAARQPVLTDERLLDMIDLVDLMRLSENTIRRMIADGEFPKPLLIPPKSARPEQRWTLKMYREWARRRELAATA